MRRLIIRPGAIGDCILSLPALEHLRTGHTEVWAPSAVVPLVQCAHRVNSIASTGLDRIGLNTDEQIPQQFLERLQTFDQIVSWYGANRPDFRAAIESLGVPCVFHRALPDEGSTVHATDYFCAQVGAPAGLMPRIEATALAGRRTIVIQPFSGSSRKNWPLEHYRELASRLPLPVEWLAGPDESLDDAHRLDNLLEVARWLSGAALYIGNDSGITHLAAAVGLPVIALFRATEPAIWSPRGSNVTVVGPRSFDIAAVVKLAEKQLVGRFAG